MKRSNAIGIVPVFLIILFVWAPTAGPPPVEASLPAVPIDLDNFEIDGDMKPFQVAMMERKIGPGVLVYILTLQASHAVAPPEFTLKWRFPSVGVQGFWNSNIDVDKVNTNKNIVTSRAANQAPVMAFLSPSDRNRLTVACSDALNTITLESFLKEEDALFHCALHFFQERGPAITKYRAIIRFDTRDIPFYEALQDVSEWWEKQIKYTPAKVPNSARLPMVSIRTSFHRNLKIEDVVNECRLARELGFEAVIVDDGRQTHDNGREYAFSGEWKPERIPEMKRFVQQIHDLKMKFILRYSVPFIGQDSEAIKKFKGKTLRYCESRDAYVLDPRYPDVREFIINIYKNALRDWNVDGFKLDFIGFFIAAKDTAPTLADGRDFALVNEAVDRLMRDIMACLKNIKPNIMMEFRQPCIGPLMRKYGNMFRAADCPNMAVVNRVRTTDIRLLSGNTPVHSGMVIWHPDEPVEVAALQILNIMFSVPQLSVRLNSQSDEHIKMIRFWMGYWKENRDVLLDGSFVPSRPGALYPIIRSGNNEKTIVVLYEDMVVSLNELKTGSLDVVNAKASERVVLDGSYALGQVEIAIYDCMGNPQEKKSCRLSGELHKFKVPPSGLLFIKKVKLP